MKKICTTLIAIFSMAQISFAQSYLPLTAGNGYPLSGLLVTNVYNNNQVALNNNGTDYGFIINPSVETWALGYGPSLSTLGTSVLSWNANGHVGISTINPIARLQVGDASANSNLKYRALVLQGGYATTSVRQQNLMTFGTLGSGYMNADPFLDTENGNNRNWHIGIVSDNDYFQNNRFSFVQNGTEQMVIKNGYVGIGTITPDTKLAVAGTIHAKAVKVDLIGWPDYVFQPTYYLPPLSEVKNYIDKNSHLPNMPSAQDVEKEGLDLGEINKSLLKKVEELTLYLIEQNTQLSQQNERIRKLESALNTRDSK